MQTQYDIYGMGNALVDMEFEVSDEFLHTMGVEKGCMTLVEQERQFELLNHLRGERSARSGGGSAANTVVANALFGGVHFIPAWLPMMNWVIFMCRNLAGQEWIPICRASILQA